MQDDYRGDKEHALDDETTIRRIRSIQVANAFLAVNAFLENLVFKHISSVFHLVLFASINMIISPNLSFVFRSLLADHVGLIEHILQSNNNVMLKPYSYEHYSNKTLFI